MKLSQLQMSIVVVDSGSLSAAALGLKLRQSTISHAIIALEQEIGVPLLFRGHFGARATPVGERVMVHARKIFDLLEKINHEINLEKGLKGGTVRIASFRSAATHLLPPILTLFRSQFPDITVTLIERELSKIEQTLRENQADISFVPLPTSDEFLAWEIARDEYVVLLPQQEEFSSSVLTWEQLSEYSFILPEYEKDSLSRIQEHWAAANQSLEIAYIVREDSTVVSMVAQGLGAAILPRLAASPLPQGVQVYQLPVPLERVIGVATLPDALSVPAIAAFLSVLGKTCIVTPHLP